MNANYIANGRDALKEHYKNTQIQLQMISEVEGHSPEIRRINF